MNSIIGKPVALVLLVGLIVLAGMTQWKVPWPMKGVLLFTQGLIAGWQIFLLSR